MRRGAEHNCCRKQAVKRGFWSPDEDIRLIRYISAYGHGCWSSLPDRAGLQRCGKSCRLRWMNYLRPGIKRGNFSKDEESIIICLHRIMDNRWAQIARYLPGRTDSEIKNYWNSCLKKRLNRGENNSRLNAVAGGSDSSKGIVELQCRGGGGGGGVGIAADPPMDFNAPIEQRKPVEYLCPCNEMPFHLKGSCAQAMTNGSPEDTEAPDGPVASKHSFPQGCTDQLAGDIAINMGQSSCWTLQQPFDYSSSNNNNNNYSEFAAWPSVSDGCSSIQLEQNEALWGAIESAFNMFSADLTGPNL